MSLQNRDIAIIGIAGTFPGAKTVSEFRDNLKHSVCSIQAVSEKRMVATNLDPESAYKKSGYLEDIDVFDHHLFGISHAEAVNMDPHQRKILETVYTVIENAGYNFDDLKGSKTSVYLSDVELNYYKQAERFEETLVIGNYSSCTAGRVSRFFDFKGNSAMIDTSCSSSLVALNIACNDLLAGDSDYSIVGGVHMTIVPPEANDPIDIGILSPDATVRPFSEGANGTVFSEAVAGILLKPFHKAMADGDHIHAVIKSVAVNQDAAASASLTSPSSQAQTEVLLTAWDKAGIVPDQIGYIETHGTGTKLGDPIEIEGIRNAFLKRQVNPCHCAIGAVKANIGHTVGVSGLAGLFKAVLSLKHRELYPSIHFSSPNPLIDFHQSGVYVNTSYKPWESAGGQKRIACVSSFGISGTNVHVVLEEAPVTLTSTEMEPGLSSLCISAKTAEALSQSMEESLRLLDVVPRQDLHRAAVTLLSGRKHYDYRAILNGITKETIALQTVQANGFEKCFLIFSPFQKHNQEYSAFLSRTFPLFHQKFEGCCQAGQHVKDKERLHYFAFQYAFLFLLKHLEADTRRIIGLGDGKLVVNAVLEKQPLAVILEELNVPEVRAADEKQRFENFFVKEAATGQLSFIEIGGAPELIEHIGRLVKHSGTPHCFLYNQNSWEQFVNALYSSGYPLNWSKYKTLYASVIPRYEWPGYQFAPVACWLKKPKSLQKDGLSSWLKKIDWAPEPLLPLQKAGVQHILVVGSEPGDSRIVEELLKEGHQVKALSYDALEPFLKEQQQALLQKKYTLVHIFGTGHDTLSNAGRQALEQLLEERLPLLKTIINYKKNIGRVAFLNLEEDATAHRPAVISAGDALLKTMYFEHPELSYKTIIRDKSSDIRLLVDELSLFDHINVCLLSQNKRYVPVLSPLADLKATRPVTVKKNGLYVIIGGAKGIGFEIACSIAQQEPCRLIVIGRSSPDDEAVRKSMESLHNHKALATYLQADVSVEKSLLNVLKSISLTDTIHGIVFAAGQMSSRSVEDISFEEIERECLSKLNGAIELVEFSRQINPDFITLFSSSLAITSFQHSLSYAMANAIVNEVVDVCRNPVMKVINWSGWESTGLLKSVSFNDAALLAKAQGVQLFWKIVELDRREVLVSNEKRYDVYKAFFSYQPSLTHAMKPAGIEQKEQDVEGQTTEAFLQKNLSDILGIDKIEPHEDYLDLGLHSLNGAQFMMRLNSHFNQKFEFYDLYDYPTISELAAYIDKKVSEMAPMKKAEAAAPAVKPTVYELSRPQMRIWLSEQIEPSALFNISGAWIIEGSLDVAICQQAFTNTVRKHDALRTAFINQKGTIQQQVMEAGNFSLGYEDLSGLPEAEQVERTDASVKKYFNHRFKLHEADVFIAGILRINKTKHILVTCLHHIISDIWSVRILMEDFLKSYQLISNGHSGELDSLPLNFMEYFQKQSQGADPAVEKEALAWLKAETERCRENPLPLPYDYESTAKKNKDAGCFILEITEEYAELKELCKARGVSLYMVMLSAFKVLLHKWTGSALIPVGTPDSGRDSLQTEAIVGYFLKELPLATDIPEHESFLNVLLNVKRKLQQTMKYKSFLESDALYADRNTLQSSGQRDLYNVIFTWNQFNDMKFDLGNSVDWNITQIQGRYEHSHYDLWLITDVYKDKLAINFIYRKQLFEASSLNWLAAQYRGIVHDILKNIESPVKDLRFEAKKTALTPNTVKNIDIKLNL